MEKKDIKLLIVLESFQVGGGQRMVYELIKKFDYSSMSVRVLCVGNRVNNDLERAVESLVPVAYLGFTGKVTVRRIARVLREIQKCSPDVVHSHLGGNIYCLIWKLVFNGNLLITAHTEAPKAFSKMSEKLVRFLLKRDGFVIATVSDENYIKFSDLYGTNKGNSISINNGIDTEEYLRKTHEVFTYIHVARQDQNKNQKMIISAFAKLHSKYNNTRLILLGDGPERQTILQMIKSLGLADGGILAPGNVSNTQDYYAIADCYVQASYREAMPLSVLEAMATGMPIISTDVGGLRDVVKPQNGYLISPGDEDALYQAMLAIYEMNIQHYDAMVQKSKEIVKEYSSPKMAERYMNVYRKMLE